MASLRGVLSDQVGEVSVDVQGTLEGAGGSFDFPDMPAVMEGVMNGQTFTLSTDDGRTLSIRIDDVSPGSAPDTSRATFTVV